VHRKFLGTILNPTPDGSAELIHDAALLVDSRGSIVACGPVQEVNTEEPCEIFDFSHLLLVPGFVDCHCHIAQVRAVNVRYAELLTWLERVVFPLEIGYDRKTVADEAPRFFSHLLSTGTTTSGLFVTVDEDATDEVFRVADKLGVRSVIGKVMMDRNSPAGLLEDTEASIEASIRLCDKWHGNDDGRLGYAFTPRFALTCSQKLMDRTGQAAIERDAFVATHVAENQAEVQRARELFPDARSYLDVYHRAGLLKKGSILTHGIYLDEQDWEVMAQTGAGLAHCPISNLLLESGILDLSQPHKHGVPVGLGSDIGAGSDPAITEVAESAVNSQAARKVLGHSHRTLTPEAAFYMMTLGGAGAMGLDDRIGDFTPGKEADLVVLDPRACLPLGEWPDEMGVAGLLYAILLRFRTAAVKEVYVRGKIVYPVGSNTDPRY
jgi:guanine deaminase